MMNAVRLNELIRDNGMTGNKLAKAVGVSPQYISLIRKGRRNNPSSVVLQRIAKALNTTIDELVRDNNENKATKGAKRAEY